MAEKKVVSFLRENAGCSLSPRHNPEAWVHRLFVLEELKDGFRGSTMVHFRQVEVSSASLYRHVPDRRDENRQGIGIRSQPTV